MTIYLKKVAVMGINVNVCVFLNEGMQILQCKIYIAKQVSSYSIKSLYLVNTSPVIIFLKVKFYPLLI